MFKGFKDFLLRGNVVELSVAVVIGTAFTAIVTAFTDKILKPLLNAITPPASPGFGVQLVAGKASTFVDLAALLTAAINFVLVAAVVYFAIVLPLKTIQERRKRGDEAGPAEPTDVELLKEIRDLLRNQWAGGDRPPAGSVEPEPDRDEVVAPPEQTVPFVRPTAPPEQPTPPTQR